MKIIHLIVTALLITAPVYGTDITYSSKSTGDTVTAADMNSIKTAVNSKQDKPAEGAFADGDKAKLDGIETGATADQTATEVVIADSGEIITGTNVETALQEIKAAADLNTAKETNTDDQTAAEVPFTPEGTIAATNVQTAIQEVRDDAVADDTAYGISWDANTDAATKNAIYDKISTVGSASVNDTAFFAGWNGETTTAGSRNAVYDYLIQFDADADGSFTDETWFPVQPVTASKAAAYTVGTDSAGECYGGTVYVTSAAVITACDGLVDGMKFTVITIGAIAVSVDVQSDDRMYLDGTALDDGDKATNTSTTGDMITCAYESAAGWYCASNTWTDGGP